MRVGVVGLGYWGPNIARNLARDRGLRAALAVRRRRRRARAPRERRSPARARPASSSELLAGRRARRRRAGHARADARRAGDRAWRRPASTASWRSRWRRTPPTPKRPSPAADAAGTLLMVGHLLEYHPAVARLKELDRRATSSGRCYYLYGNRLNLGVAARRRERAVEPRRARRVGRAASDRRGARASALAQGASYVREGVEDVVFCYLRFPSGIVAHLHLSWLDPHKERRLTVVGARAHGDVRRHARRGQAGGLRQGL